MRRVGDIARQQSSYRRGLVLGLTVAESMLLILFALLLALGFVLGKQAKSERELHQKLAQVEEARRLLETKIEVLDALARNQPPDEFFKELVRAREAQAELDKAKSELVERERAVSKLEKILQHIAGKPDEQKRVAELAARGAALQEAIAAVSPDAAKKDLYDYIPQGVALAQAAAEAHRSPEETRQMLKDSERGARENATLKGQVNRMRSELASVGKGGDYPPCWITEQGVIEYLFDISLNGDGTLTVKDATPPLRIADRRDLALPPQLYGRVSRGAFLAMTEPLLRRSNEKGCRYYVIARDRTGESQKTLFKTLLINTVEARFYKSIRP